MLFEEKKGITMSFMIWYDTNSLTGSQEFDNLNIIKEYLILNNYPNKFIDKYIRKRTIEIYNKNNITLNKTNPVAEKNK